MTGEGLAVHMQLCPPQIHEGSPKGRGPWSRRDWWRVTLLRQRNVHRGQAEGGRQELDPSSREGPSGEARPAHTLALHLQPPEG